MRRSKTSTERKSESIIGLWNLSRTPYHRMLSAREGKDVIKEGYRRGIRYFDTAYSYGDAESILQSAMKELGKDDYSVISKVMPVPTAAKKAEATLRRLKREYIDILLLHWPSADDSLYSSLKALEKLKNEGKALAIGVSNFPSELLIKTAEDFPISFHERPLSLIWTKDWEKEKDLKGIRTLAYAPLGMGLLSGRYRRGEDIKDSRATLTAATSPLLGLILDAIDNDPAIALSWVYDEKPFGVISGYSDKEDLKILDRIRSLPENRREELRKLADDITAAELSDNIFSHNWRGNAYTT